MEIADPFRATLQPVWGNPCFVPPMHHTSLSKIESASAFLLWFRANLSQELQTQLRPYLAQPYQSALKVLECCGGDYPIPVNAIAQRTHLSRDSVRQVLKVLQAQGLVVPSGSVRGWKTQLVAAPAAAERSPDMVAPALSLPFPDSI